MNNKNMAVIAYANGWTMWEYTDTGKTIQEIIQFMQFLAIQIIHISHDTVFDTM